MKESYKHMKMLRVSIGIPAYNEEANIGELLSALTQQKMHSGKIVEIIVVSDKCNDGTDDIVTSNRDPRIRLIRNSFRMGQALSQNEILKQFTGDVLVLLNADILPSSSNTLDNLIQPFIKNARVGMVSGRTDPLPAHTLTGSLFTFAYSLKNDIYAKWKNGINAYTFYGRVRALSKDFAQILKFPVIVAEDTYVYLTCLENGFDCVYVNTPCIRFRAPETLADHVRQSSRFFLSQHELSRYFDTDVLHRELALPFLLKISVTFRYFFQDPVRTIIYLVVLVSTQIFGRFAHDPSATWEPSHSSKSL